MKHTLFLATVLVSLGIFSQNVYIPDLKFKRALLANTAINTDSNPQEISVAEAKAFTGTINVSNQQIQNLTGIEAFVNITKLYCFNNKLTSLDVSKNILLTELECGNNSLPSLNVSKNTKLTTLKCYLNKLPSLNVSNNTELITLNCSSSQLPSLNVSKNTKLTTLKCSNNKLTSLDVSKNILLTRLECGYNNQLSSLDVSQNTALKVLACNNSQLTSLDISQNTALEILYCQNNNLTSLNLANRNNQNLLEIDVINNPNLTCIQIDTGFTPNNQYWEKDATANYSTNCSLGVDDIELNSQEVSIYPNPVQDVLNVALAHSKVKSVVVYNVLGAEVLRSTSSSIAVQSLPLGIYIVKVEDIKGRKFANKIVKK